MTKSKAILRLLIMVMVALAACGTGWAQATGSLVGTVSDKAGAIIPGAKVTLTNAGTNEVKVSQSDASGNYQFIQLIPGTYKVQVEQQGFQKFLASSVTVAIGNASRVDASLQVGNAATETVEVTTQAELLSTQSSSLNYGVVSAQVAQLPLNGRNVLNLMELVPGVVPQGGTSGNAATGNVNAWGNYQIGGGVGNQSATYIDGAPINVSYVNSTILVPTQESVQEFQVQTNTVSPEFGRFAGGIMNMATKQGTNDLHGDLYYYVRNAALNANLWFNKHNPAALAPTPVYTQNQYGATLGGPVMKNKAFFFLSWEQFDLTTATLTTAQVPTTAMYAGDFSTVSAQLYDPFNATCGTNGLGSGTSRCAYVPANGYTGTGAGQIAGANNQIPTAEINSAALNIAKFIYPTATNALNPSTGANNFTSNVPKVTDYNQWMARGDQTIGKNSLFERFTDWHKNFAGNSSYYNKMGNRSYFATDQAVIGDTITLNNTTIATVHASFLRFVDKSIPLSCCTLNDSTTFGPGWAAVNAVTKLAMAPFPNVTGMVNYNGNTIIEETDNAYVLSGSLTKMIGRHSIQAGGEIRKIEWDYAQSNSAGGTFNSPSTNGYTSSAQSGGTGGYGLAAELIGTATQVSAAEPVLSKGVMWYSGLFVNDAFRMTPKLTINAGLRWEQPGSFTETHGLLTTMLMNLPQTAVSTALGKTVTGGLGLINSTAYPHKTWQQLHWTLFSPRVGFAYNPTSKWVVRGGFGINYLPPTVSFSLGPYNDPLNLSTTTINSNTPVPGISLSNPFPNGITAPASGGSNLQNYVNSLIGTGIQSPLPSQTYPYMMQFNAGIQKQFGESTVVNVGYVAAKGNHLPLYSLNYDQLPDQYDTALDIPAGQPGSGLTMVPNPMSALNGGPIPTSAGALGAATIQQAILWKPAPQYSYMTADSPSVGENFYTALQVMASKHFGSGGVLSAAYTMSNLVGDADVLSPWLESNRYGVGGSYGAQDSTNLKGNASNPGEWSRSSFQTPNRLVVNYVYPLPIGHGKKFLSSANGILEYVAGGWTVNGISTFQTGFPLAFEDSSPNALQSTNLVGGNAGPGTGAAVTRPNYVPSAAGCNNTPSMPGTPGTKLNKYFNTACFVVPDNYGMGNEPRVDANLRMQGIDTSDFSASKAIKIHESANLDFRAEFFNIFNWTQFSPPNTQTDNAASFGKVTAQYNQPRLIQFSARFKF